MNKNSKQQYDTIIIGGGHNSLACGVHLSANKQKVLILEQNDEIGGAIKTQELTKEGFKHDTFAMNVSLFMGSAFFAKYSKQLFDNGLDVVSAKQTFSSIFADNTWIGVDTNIDNTMKYLSKINKKDAKKYQEIFECFQEDALYIFPLLASPIYSFKALRLVFKMIRKKGLVWSFDFMKMLLSSPREWLDEHFEDDKIKSLISSWGMHLDFSPDTTGGALFSYLETMANQSFGMALGKGGADTIINSMASLFKKNQGEIKTNSKVIKINIKNNIAVSVVLENGDKIVANKHIVANIHPRAYRALIDDNLLPKNHPFDKFKEGLGTMMIHYAMENLPNWSASDELKKYSYIHLAPSLDYMSQAYQEALRNEIPKNPVLVVGQPTAIDNTRAPNNKHILWVQVRVLPYDIKPQSWDDIKNDYANSIEDIISQYAPNWKKDIIKRTILSPLDLERSNVNLYKGDSLAGSHHLNQFFFFRPSFKYINWKSDFKNLHLIGASTWPGAGSGAGSGYMLATKLVMGMLRF